VASSTKAPLRRWEHRYLGEERFPETLSALEIEHFFTLDEQELARVRERRGSLNRMALALQVGFLKMTGNTLNSVERIPADILDHLGRQLDCVPPRIASIGPSMAGVGGLCSSTMRRRCGCPDAANPPRMRNAGLWLIFDAKRPPCSTNPTSWPLPDRGWSSITTFCSANATCVAR